jgi:uncharacterized membrane protein YeaQ/YmgE (transglycosylase-associated protein family)
MTTARAFKVEFAANSTAGGQPKANLFGKSGFIMTAILGIVGAFVATYLGQLVGWYGPNDGAGFIASIVGAVIVLAIWGMIARRRTTSL